MADNDFPVPPKYWLLFLPVFIIICLTVKYSTDRENKEKLDVLREYFLWVDSNEVCGRLSFVSTQTSRLQMFGLEGEPDRKYYSKIYLTGALADKDFKNFAGHGDSIIRHKFSDLLILIKEGKSYQCRWMRCFVDPK